jgi:hypothetical protein
MKCSACGSENDFKNLSCSFCGASLNNVTNFDSKVLVKKRVDDAFGWFTELVYDNNGSRCLKSRNAVFPYPLFHKDNQVVINVYYSESEIYISLSLSVKGYYSDGTFNVLRIQAFENENQLFALESKDILSVVKSKISSDQWHLDYVTFKVKIDRYALDNLIKLKNGKLILGDGKNIYYNTQSGKLFVDLSENSSHYILLGSYNSFYMQSERSEYVLARGEEIQKAIYFVKKFISEDSYARLFETKYPSIFNIESIKNAELTEAFKSMDLPTFKKYSDENAQRIRSASFSSSKSHESVNDSSYRDAATKGSSKKDSSCYIATAAMGSYDHPTVVELRNFRDNWLLKREWGIRFTKWYYTYGSKAARIIEKSNLLKRATYLIVVKPLHLITKKIIK